MTRALARIDAAAVERNCAHLAATVGDGVELCAVVKADGYGHGADACAEAALAGGATRLAVATGAEAVAKRIAESHHNHLPVVEGDGSLAGMVTRADALAALVG